MNTNRMRERVLGLPWAGTERGYSPWPGPSDFFLHQERCEERLCPPERSLDTCDSTVAPLEAPLQGSGLRCSRPGYSSTGIAGRAGDRLEVPGTFSPLFRSTLPTVITLPAVPHMPLRFSLGLLLVELESGRLISWEQKDIFLKQLLPSMVSASSHLYHLT